MRDVARVFVALSILGGSAMAGHDQPTLEEASQALDRAWIKLTPDGMTERNVLFESIEAGQPNGETYPFRVTVTTRDYGPGYPPNGYFGQTCVTKIPAEAYRLSRDAFGDWQVQGRMNVFDPGDRCEDNPAESATSIPLDSLPGQPASATPAAAPRALLPEERSVVTGEWSCSGNGQVLSGPLHPGFVVMPWLDHGIHSVAISACEGLPLPPRVKERRHALFRSDERHSAPDMGTPRRCHRRLYVPLRREAARVVRGIYVGCRRYCAGKSDQDMAACLEYRADRGAQSRMAGLVFASADVLNHPPPLRNGCHGQAMA